VVRVLAGFRVLVPGQYRITGEYSLDSMHMTRIRLHLSRYLVTSPTLNIINDIYIYSYNDSFSINVPSNVIVYPGDTLYLYGELERGAFTKGITVRNIRLRANLSSRPYAATVVNE